MFNSVNASLRVARAFAEERALLALRWGLDVARGYTRAADGREGILRCLDFARGAVSPTTAEKYADHALDALKCMTEARAEPGPLGVGARLAMSPFEFVRLRVMAEDLRSEALRREQQNTGVQA